MPRPLVNVSLAALIGTGCDTLSKIAMELATFNAIIIFFKFSSKALLKENLMKCSSIREIFCRNDPQAYNRMCQILTL